MVWAPAKLNLFLEVLARRRDGYHEIETLITAIDIYDTLYFVVDPGSEIRFRVMWTLGYPWRRAGEGDRAAGAFAVDVPGGSDNLAVRAAELLRQRAGIEAGARMVLSKRIAAAAGLGGASSDAAAALVAANIAWGVDWPRGRLCELASELGSDVRFFLGPTSAAICRGRGERVEPVGGFGGYHFVVVSPADGLATASVYQRSGVAAAPQSVQPVLQEASRQGPAGLGRMLFNRLQAAASQMSPSINVLRDQFARLDLLGHQMSGSGTSYFGICRHARQARNLAALLSAQGLGTVFHAASCPASCHVLRLSHQA